MITLHHGDCLEIMKTIPDNSVELILCDLPYQTTALKWDVIIPFEPLWEQYRRILTSHGAIVLTASQPFTTMLAASNLEWLKYSLVWEKSRATGFLQASKRPLRKHEDILVFSPGTVTSGSGTQVKNNMTYNPQGLVELGATKLSKNGKGRDYMGKTCFSKPNLDSNAFAGDVVRGSGRNQTHTNYPTSILRFDSERKTVHPTQKPLALMEYLVRTFSNEGETVLDNTMGSGTTGVAAVNTGRNFIGIEQDEKYFQIAKDRIDPWGDFK